MEDRLNEIKQSSVSIQIQTQFCFNYGYNYVSQVYKVMVIHVKKRWDYQQSICDKQPK